MVMRRVLKHHVCLCVLSTAIVAGLALITSQKVYAQYLKTNMGNCKGMAGSGSRVLGGVRCGGMMILMGGSSVKVGQRQGR
ncbi:hypothetical protein [Bartonella sp. WD16.2]|uniref:hypothetical protein n=1 Tax=Bartonella sp. WD16.2 TaxID=1933904 RepID=UPI00099905F0|nr:hypothetical protein [Bartonella sp. WD16.2]AQX19226.1 hypothetical protein BWD162_000860 [Bartonella sp. WD16.2]